MRHVSALNIDFDNGCIQEADSRLEEDLEDCQIEVRFESNRGKPRAETSQQDHLQQTIVQLQYCAVIKKPFEVKLPTRRF